MSGMLAKRSTCTVQYLVRSYVAKGHSSREWITTRDLVTHVYVRPSHSVTTHLKQNDPPKNSLRPWRPSESATTCTMHPLHVTTPSP